MPSVDTSRLVVSSTGRTSFSGLGSGIDFEGAVEAMVNAKRIPIDRLELDIEKNNGKVQAYTDLTSRMTALRESLNKLRGVISADKSSNIFLAKETFASSSRGNSLLYNPNKTTASSAGALLGVSVTNAADVGSHTIEILRTAKAHKVSSGAFSSSSTALNTLNGAFAGGDIEINDVVISVEASNTLGDVRDRINNAGAGVTASIVSASPTEHYLVITNDETGVDITFDATLSNVLEDLGVTNAASVPSNVLQAAQTALFTADGLRDQTRKQSDIIYNPGATLATLAPGLITDGGFLISDGVIGVAVSYTTGMTINELVQEINDQALGAGSNITASLEAVEGGNGGFRLVIESGSGDNITLLDDDGETFVSTFAFTDPKILERTSNTVSDLIPGVTLNLFASEGGTTIKIDVEKNLTEVKTQIAAFVEAYNEMVRFTNEQTAVDPVTGQPTEETGLLFGSQVLADVKARIGNIFASGASGVSSDFTQLAAIGIKFVSNNEVSDPLDYNTLKIDEAKLDEKLLNNAEDVRRMFTFNGSTNDSRFTITSFSGSQEYTSSGVTVDFVHDGTTFTSASIGGDSSAVEVLNGNTLKILTGPGAGMILFYNGGASAGSVTSSYTMGFAAKMFSELDDLLTLDTGAVDLEIDTLKKINETKQDDIDLKLERLETFRQQQLEKFYRMEQAMSRAKSILDSLTQTVEAQNKNS